MNKNNILLSTAITIFVGLLMLSGCTDLINDLKGFEELAVSDHFAGNRDCHCIKLNNSFFAMYIYENKDVEIYKLLDSTSDDLFGSSELYYTDNISECYSNDSNILVYSLTYKKYIMIDCNDVNNTKILSETDIQKIDLSKFTKVDIPSYDDGYLVWKQKNTGDSTICLE